MNCSTPTINITLGIAQIICLFLQTGVTVLLFTGTRRARKTYLAAAKLFDESTAGVNTARQNYLDACERLNKTTKDAI